MYIYFLTSKNNFPAHLKINSMVGNLFYLSIKNLIQKPTEWDYENRIEFPVIESILIEGHNLSYIYDNLIIKLRIMLETYFKPNFLEDMANNPFGDDYEPAIIVDIVIDEEVFQVDTIFDLGFEINLLYSFLIEPMRTEIENDGKIGVISTLEDKIEY